MNSEVASGAPGGGDGRVNAQAFNLIEHVELTKTVICGRFACARVSLVKRVRAFEPSPYDIVLGTFGGANAPATVMAGDNDVAYAEHIDCKGEGGLEARIASHCQIGDVAMHKHFAGIEIDNFCCGHAAVGTTDPEICGPLLCSQTVEEVGIR